MRDHAAGTGQGSQGQPLEALRGRFEGREEEFEEALQSPFQQQVTGALVKRLGGAPPGPALEAGSGAGALLQALGGRGRKLLALDITPAMARLARRRLGVAALVGDGATLPLAAGSLALMGGSFYFQLLPRPALALQESLRVLMPGGRLALAIQAPGFDEERARGLARTWQLESPALEHLVRCARLGPGSRRYKPLELVALLRRAGFQQVQLDTLFAGAVLLVSGVA